MRRRSGGFTYVGVIVLVAIIGLVAATTIKLGSLLQRRSAELELLYVGDQFAAALRSFADTAQPGQRKSPVTLEELLRDPRVAGVRRHLRKIYPDPMTGKLDWGIVRGLDKVSIVGVYSLSDATPIKQANFPAGYERFERKTKISEWQFVLAGAIGTPMTGGDMAKPPSEPMPAAPQPRPEPAAEAAPAPQTQPQPESEDEPGEPTPEEVREAPPPAAVAEPAQPNPPAPVASPAQPVPPAGPKKIN